MPPYWSLGFQLCRYGYKSLEKLQEAVNRTKHYNIPHVSSYKLSHLVGKPTMWFPTRSDTNRPVQAQKRDRILKFRIQVEEELYYPSSENKGADQFCGYREADLRLCFRLCRLLVFP